MGISGWPYPFASNESSLAAADSSIADARKVDRVNIALVVAVIVILYLVGAALWIAAYFSQPANLQAWRVSGQNRTDLKAQQAVGRQQGDLEAQARTIQQWQAAYALANPGAPIPAPPMVVGASFSARNRTNTMAVLAIIFGFFVGILGIVFGHVALSQISRTGEGGRGLAITGLVFGYFGVGLAAILTVVALAQLHP
jgi:hypothetical protein